MLNTDQISFRQATADDLAQIVSFTNSIHLQEDDQSIPTNKHFLFNLEKWLKEELNNSLSLFLIADFENNFGQTNSIGFIGATTVINDNGFLENPTKGVINLLWIEKEHRKKNIAKQLVSMIEDCFKENAINVIECSFTDTNELAKKFWSNMHYKIFSVTARKIISDTTK
ncbi:MAG: hypothetical protein COA86_03220 [Kangiella sp.]|nr:MAG: hypothetical protein COA86_03220 [Kangiella sp.]